MKLPDLVFLNEHNKEKVEARVRGEKSEEIS